MPTTTAPEAVTEPNEGPPARSSRRRNIRGLATLLLLTAAAGYGVYALTGTDTPAKPPVPTAAVTYSITGTGTADLTYLATSEEGTATTEKAVPLPWKKTVQVPLGKPPVIKVQLPQQGGTATCALAIRDQHMQRATAAGAYGRATCTAALPVGAR
ncbi:hypothetical protein [Streptomyces sp. NPDC058657]|uniref:hypothetical protein n=1 Tax=unclassified Streptomyces TaxID=2593676 RepID=UPI003664E711